MRTPFYQPDDPLEGFSTIPVPSCWQMHSYDQHQYTNIRYPFPADPPYVPQVNPCGAYVRCFPYRREENLPRAFLNFEGVDSFGMSPLQGDLNVLIASCSEYTFLTKGKWVDGTMYSCTSLGVKLGGGLGTAMCGWLLEWSSYDGLTAVQTSSCLNMLHVMYLWIPMAINLLIALLLVRMNVEKENQRLKERIIP